MESNKMIPTTIIRNWNPQRRFNAANTETLYWKAGVNTSGNCHRFISHKRTFRIPMESNKMLPTTITKWKRPQRFNVTNTKLIIGKPGSILMVVVTVSNCWREWRYGGGQLWTNLEFNNDLVSLFCIWVHLPYEWSLLQGFQASGLDYMYLRFEKLIRIVQKTPHWVADHLLISSSIASLHCWRLTASLPEASIFSR